VKAARNEGTWGAIIGLEGGSQDEVLFASLAPENAQVLFLTKGNREKEIDPRGLRFEVNTVNTVVSPSARGVAGIAMLDGDPILNGLCFDVEAKKDGYVIVLTDMGFAKKMKLAEFPVQGRAGKGVITMKHNPKIGMPVSYALANDGDALDLLSQKGKRLRILVKDIPDLGRAKNAVNIASKYDGLFGDEPVASIIVVEMSGEAESRKSRTKEKPTAAPQPATPAGPSAKRDRKTVEQPSLLPTNFEEAKKAGGATKPAVDTAVKKNPKR
jgi:hypothetical protein